MDLQRCATTFFGCETNFYDQNTHFHIFGFLVAQAHMVDPTPPPGGGQGPPEGAPEGPRRGFRYGSGTDLGGTRATFYDCFGLFKHILTDFDFFRFMHTPFTTIAASLFGSM